MVQVLGAPAYQYRLIGRRDELRLARQQLVDESARLLTISGEPGIGKTRLALQIAEELRAAYEGCVFFVPLDEVDTADEVIGEVARHLGAQPDVDDALGQLVQVFEERPAVLILDSFEHVLEARQCVSDLLAKCPLLHVIVTSRTRLHLARELEIRLGALSADEALHYFLERAQLAVPGAALDSDEVRPAVAEICRYLDGVPLALDLAARRLAVFRTPSALLDRLRWGLLPVLVDGPEDWPARHHTMRDAIEWSYGLLDERSQAALAQLSIIEDGFSPDVAAAVLDQSYRPRTDAVDALAELVMRGFARVEDRGGGDVCFHISPVVREYAREWLAAHDQVEAVEQRYVLYGVRLAELAGEQMLGARQVDWLERLERERPHVDRALRWADENADANVGLAVTVALTFFWALRGLVNEGRAWLETFLEHAESEPAQLRARALAADGILAAFGNRFEEARASLLTAANQLREPSSCRALAWTLLWLGNVTVDLGEAPEARKHYQHSLALFTEIGDRSGLGWSELGLGNVERLSGADIDAWAEHFEAGHRALQELDDAWGTGTALRYLANVAYKVGNYDRAAELYQECVGRFRALGFAETTAWSLNAWGDVERCRLHAATAQLLYEEALSVFSQLKIATGVAWAKHNLSYLVLSRGDIGAAADLLRDSLTTFVSDGLEPGVASAIAGCAQIALARGDAVSAARLLGVAQGICSNLEPVDQMELDRARTETRRRLGSERQLLELAYGQYLRLEDANELARLSIDTGAAAARKQVPTVQDLTPREREVVRLIASGYKDRDIADALVMTRATASWHVRNVLSKLSLTRSQVGIWAFRQGLLEPRVDRRE